jgi:hypothetical protein
MNSWENVSGPLAKWENEDGYLKYLLYFEDDEFVLRKQDLNARIAVTKDSLKAFTLESAIRSAEAVIKPAEKQLVRVY